MEWIINHWEALSAGLLWVLNEIIAANPNWKSNSLIQLVINAVKALLGSKKPPLVP